MIINYFLKNPKTLNNHLTKEKHPRLHPYAIDSMRAGRTVGGKMNLKETLAELRKGKERKFEQSIDLIINLKNVDLKRDQINIIVNLPHRVKDKKVCGFLAEKSKLVKTITEPEFKKYGDIKELKHNIKQRGWNIFWLCLLCLGFLLQLIGSFN